ncbi:MAG: hypothetical protein CL917_03275 [Deltaproteobacteria bacterium]|nr:hypothetical protein [Deltaproteobacteria bacterium]
MGKEPSIREFCINLLDQGDLASKLAPPRTAHGAPLADNDPGQAIFRSHPAREPKLSLSSGAEPLPRPGQLRQAEARARCLARFAHHELMAVELFAWALLRWPDLPAELRRLWLATLAEEQIHCRLYLDRLAAHGSDLSEHCRSDYFWKQLPAIEGSPHGPKAFLAAMGLTLEQANLDFTLVYRDGFREAGDLQSAQVCQRVHDDEVLHVRRAAEWLIRLSPEHGEDGVAAYEESVPFPLAANRAKGRRFDQKARRSAGLSEAFIEHVRTARSSQQVAGSTKPS